MSNLGSKSTNDFVLSVATVNGSGSQSSNNVLVKSLFRLGLPVGGKNMFPSNIAGLPTWYTIRVNADGFTGRKSPNDICVAMNADTIVKDQYSVKPDGVFLYNSDLKVNEEALRKDLTTIAIPFREIVKPVSDSVKLRKLLTNMVYAGIVAELLAMDEGVCNQAIRDQFIDKLSVVEANLAAFSAGRTYAKEFLEPKQFPYKVNAIPGGNKGKLLIDGNSAAAMGLLAGGCTMAAWYPITPSSSLVEGFESLAKKYRVNKEGQSLYSVVQAEDELASICMVVGAGWAGARAMTATSGPGLSLMAEAAGLAYYAEIPAVVWDVQRVGPSTGLPTRTMQGDLLSAYFLSHGDGKHVVLLPGNPRECFEFAQTAFDLAERLQTLVIVLSDLDMGMNLSITESFTIVDKKLDRGKVLSEKDVEKLENFARYRDIDGDGIGYRTLPGTHHDKASYFTRGSGHDERALYTEDNKAYRSNMDRLLRKWETAKTLVPTPVIEESSDHKVGLIYYGSSHDAVMEAKAGLLKESTPAGVLRVRALPMGTEVKSFLDMYEQIYVIEQNRDGQLRQILQMEFPQTAGKLRSIHQYDGLPLEGEYVLHQLKVHFGENHA